MPLYEYKCSSCEKIHEVMQKFSDAPLEVCPECGGSVAKIMSLSSFALKGSGWYTTDYKKSSSSSSSSASSSTTKKEADKPVSTDAGSSSSSSASS